VRADAIKDDLPTRLYRSHCTNVSVGIESGDDSVLAAMNKRATSELYRTTIASLSNAGVSIRASLIIGHPGETEETFNNTMKFLNTLDCSGPGIFSFLFAPFFLVPLSPNYEPEMRARFELSGYLGKWKHKTMSSDDMPRLIQEAFFKTEENAFHDYFGDNVLSGYPRNTLRRIMTLRQQARKLQARSQIDGTTLPPAFDNLIDQLRQEYFSMF
jgi:radical SAM superfamily enzyme YgiQ (UPF0313 family)